MGDQRNRTRRLWIQAGLIVMVLFIFGCQNGSYMAFIDGLNQRKIQSCLRYNGAIQLGGGSIGGSSGALQGITATGGAPIEMCKELLD